MICLIRKREAILLIVAVLLFAFLVVLSGCGGGKEETETQKSVERQEETAMKLVTEAFESAERIPAKYTCTGEDISPPLTIENIDPEAESLVLIMDDPDAPAGVFDHWLLWNIPPDRTEIPEGIAQKEKVNELDGAVQGKNDFGELGYRGPCPPGGSAHEYRLRLYGLDEKLDLEPGSTKDKLEEAIKGLVIEKTVLTGVYSR